MLSLEQLTFLNTRPVHQSEALTALLEYQGMEVISCPALMIEWLSLNEPGRQLAKDLDNFDKVVITSVNALIGWIKNFPELFEFSGSEIQQNLTENIDFEAYRLKKLPQHCQIFAIGEATSSAGRKIGLSIEYLNRVQYDSEDLLNVLAGQDLGQPKKFQQQKIALMTGVGGRTALLKGMQRLGAEITELEFYQRVAAPFCKEQWQAFRQASYPVLLISSLDSFQKLHQSLIEWDPHYEDLNSHRWHFIFGSVVFSERIREYLLHQGWHRKTAVTPIQSNKGILGAIKSLLSVELDERGIIEIE